MGTYIYMAPEIWRHNECFEDDFNVYEKKELYEACDMWSFGCTLYEVCMLKKAFKGVT